MPQVSGKIDVVGPVVTYDEGWTNDIARRQRPAVTVQGPGLLSTGGNSVHSSGELPDAVRGFPHHAGGAFGSMAFTGMRTGSLTLSTLSRPTGHLGSGQSAGSPGAATSEFGRSGGGPLQQSQSVPATPTMLLNGAAGPATGGRFADTAALRDNSHSASAPVLPTAPSGTSSGEAAQQGSSLTERPDPSAAAAAGTRPGVEPAAGAHGADAGAEPQDRNEQHPSDAEAGPCQPAGSVGVKQTHRGSPANGSGSGGAAQQARAPGMRKNKFSSFSSDVPADRHWPPTAPSSGVSDSTMPADASPAPALWPEQQVRCYVTGYEHCLVLVTLLLHPNPWSYSLPRLRVCGQWSAPKLHTCCSTRRRCSHAGRGGMTVGNLRFRRLRRTCSTRRILTNMHREVTHPSQPSCIS